MIRLAVPSLLLFGALGAACSSSKDAPPPPTTPDDAGSNVDPDAGDTEEADAAPAAASCDPTTRPGEVKGSTSLKTARGLKIIVRTPPGYDASVGSPLVVTYAPAGATAIDTEGFTGLTPDAKKRGYVIAYADHIDPSSTGAGTEGAAVIKAVVDRWCIDPKRVYLTGHSDGGTMCHFVAQRELHPITAMAPSASGVNITTSSTPKCASKPLPVMEIHGTKDTLFPIASGYGKTPAAFWAKCDGCDATPGAADANGCAAYSGCGSDTEVRYCEWNGAHPQWPPLNAAIFDFFERFRLP